MKNPDNKKEINISVILNLIDLDPKEIYERSGYDDYLTQK